MKPTIDQLREALSILRETEGPMAPLRVKAWAAVDDLTMRLGERWEFLSQQAALAKPAGTDGKAPTQAPDTGV